jgi:hypothetical protein
MVSSAGFPAFGLTFTAFCSPNYETISSGLTIPKRIQTTEWITVDFYWLIISARRTLNSMFPLLFIDYST